MGDGEEELISVGCCSDPSSTGGDAEDEAGPGPRPLRTGLSFAPAAAGELRSGPRTHTVPLSSPPTAPVTLDAAWARSSLMLSEDLQTAKLALRPRRGVENPAAPSASTPRAARRAPATAAGAAPGRRSSRRGRGPEGAWPGAGRGLALSRVRVGLRVRRWAGPPGAWASMRKP